MLSVLTLAWRLQLVAAKEAAEAFKAQVGDTMKEKGDLFDVMFEAEEKIRLGEDGWKERYYQVRRLSSPRCLGLSIYLPMYLSSVLCQWRRA